MLYLFLMPFLFFDCYPEQKPRNQRKETTNRQIKEKKISMLFGLTSLLILKILGSFFASRLKRAGSLSNRKWSDNQSWQKDKKEHRNQISETKKKSWRVEWYLSLIFSRRSATVRSLLHSYMGFLISQTLTSEIKKT